MSLFGSSGKRCRKQTPSESLQVTETKNVLKVHTDKPHLVSMGSGRLSTAVTILPLHQGITTIGSTEAVPCPDIPIAGTGVEKQHCYIDNHDGVITLVPVGRQCMVDGFTVAMPTRLAQGETGVEKQNCYLDNHDGVITFVPVARQGMVDGVTVAMPTGLPQGCMLCLGRSNYFRFNHPREARKMREAMPKNYRVSCEPLRLFQGKLKPK